MPLFLSAQCMCHSKYFQAYKVCCTALNEINTSLPPRVRFACYILFKVNEIRLLLVINSKDWKVCSKALTSLTHFLYHHHVHMYKIKLLECKYLFQ